MLKAYSKIVLIILLIAGLALSFWISNGWLQLCAGLAMFLFGMQCLEEGLRLSASGKLEQLLAHRTSSPKKSLLFGIGTTMVMQSTTLVSLLTIAFISTGLIKLTAGIAILFGANLGATSGIWLLALAGQDFNLNHAALPLIVFGVVAGFAGDKGRGIGRIILGIAFILMGIDQLKLGFSDFTYELDFSRYQIDGIGGQLLFIAIGLVVTIVLQSSHAALMLTLTALGTGQLDLQQAFCIVIGANIGSSLSTAFVVTLGGNRNGQRLALAHVLFNVVSGAIAWGLLVPETWLMGAITGRVGLGDNLLIQLALFNTVFKAIGLAVLWPLQSSLVKLLKRILPGRQEPSVLIAEVVAPDAAPLPTAHARYLTENALASADSAAVAVVQELNHLGRLSIEVICHALYLPVDQLKRPQADNALLNTLPDKGYMDVEALYQRYIKGVYSDLLSFIGRTDAPSDMAHQQFEINCQMAALQLVDAVKDAQAIQKNLALYLKQNDNAARRAYVELRGYLLYALREIYELGRLDVSDEAWLARLEMMDNDTAKFETDFRDQLFVSVRDQQLDGMQMSSLMNDISYASRIVQSLRNVLMLSQGEDSEFFRELRQMTREDDNADHVIVLQ